MGIKSIAKRAQYGNRLLMLEEQGQDAIDRLQGLRQALPGLRDAIDADEALSQDEKAAAVAEVNGVILALVAQVKAFADSL